MSHDTFTLSDLQVSQRYGMSIHTLKAWRTAKEGATPILIEGVDYAYTRHGIRYRHDIGNHPAVQTFKPRSRK